MTCAVVGQKFDGESETKKGEDGSSSLGYDGTEKEAKEEMHGNDIESNIIK